MQKKSYNFIDLFSGCGGFSKGLEMAGHKCLLGVDFQKEAVETFSKNHRNAHALHMDIHNLTKKELVRYIDIRDIDMVVGGPPCQGFSTVGRGDVNDGRNSLFQQFVRVVKITKPKIVLFENVTGLLASKNTEVLHQIFSSFERLGYHMDVKVMSAELYGVPSRRRRAIIMGVRDAVPSFPKPVSLKIQKTNTVEFALGNLHDRKGKLLNHNIDSAQVSNKMDFDRLKYIPAGAGIRYQKDELAYLPKTLRYDVNWEKISEGRFRQTRLQRLPLDQPAPTILTSRTTYYHPKENRFLTVREAARLQSFPNDFIFEGSLTAQFRQIGNAVPPMLAKKLGEEIKKIEFCTEFSTKKVTKGAFMKYTLEHRKEVVKEAFAYKNSNM